MKPTYLLSRAASFEIAALFVCAALLAGCGGSSEIPTNSDVDVSKRILLFRDAKDSTLYTIKSDGSDKKKVVEGTQQPASGRLSRDRLFIATAFGTVNPRLAIAFVAGGTPTNFPDSPQYKAAATPAFSPSDSTLVFVGDSDLFTLTSDGKTLKRLTTLSFLVPATKIAPVASDPSYLDDASGILYTKTEAVDKPAADQPAPEIPSDIYRIAPDGTTEVTLTVTKNNTAARARPDGARIVFVSKRDGNHEIYLMNADGTNQTRLTQNDADDVTPVYSPDNKTLAFLSDREKAGEYKVYLMDQDGANVRKLSDALAAPGTLDWR